MIILFSGSHGTGKSTLIYELLKSEEFASKFQVSDSVSEKFFKREDFKDPEKMPDLQAAFTDYQLGVFGTDQTISSRGYADIWAYTKHLYLKSGNPKYLDQLSKIEDQAKKSQEVGSTLHCYFPIHFEIEGKELRSTNKEFQLEIDGYIQEFFEMVGIQPYPIIKGSPAERAADVCGAINAFNTNKNPGHGQ